MKGMELTKQYEGFREEIYKDTLGNLTVGWGTHLYEGKKLPKEALEAMFEYDYQKAIKEYNSLGLDLDEARRAVIIDMIYNMGLPKLLGFKNMLAALRNGDYNKAAIELLDSNYARQVKTRAIKNAEILRTGKLE